MAAVTWATTLFKLS